MSETKQVKINLNLHQEVKEFVDSDSQFSTMKSFYEEATRHFLSKHKGDDELSQAQRDAIEDFVKELED